MSLLLLLSLPPSLLLLLYSFFSVQKLMDNDSKSDGNCTIEGNVEFLIIDGVMGGIGSVTCIVALVFVLVSRFYKDIVQRLILYKLITMLIYSLSLFPFINFDKSSMYRGLFEVILITLYFANVIFTFWLTVILFICIVKLKELKNLKKLEPVAVVTSLLPFASFILVPFSHFILDNDCRRTWQIKFIKGGENIVEYAIIIYSIVGLLNFIISVLVIIIFITAIKRSQMSCKIRKNNEYESPLLTNNKWRTLSKQLLPILAYPIINTVGTLIFLPIDALQYNYKHVEVFISLLASSPGLITSIAVILHLSILNCKKKQRERRKRNGKQSLLDNAEELVHNTANENSAMFTSDTLASTNARTEYIYTRTSSFNTSML